MDSLIRPLVILAGTALAADGLYQITINGLWLAVLLGLVCWLATGVSLVAILALVSWRLFAAQPPTRSRAADTASEVRPMIAGRVGPVSEMPARRAA